MKRLVLSIVIFALALAACTAGSQGGEATPTPVPTPVVAQKPTYTVQKGTVVRSLRLQGRVAPVQQQDLYFRTDGFVQEVYVERGDVVAEGDVLARLDQPEKYASDIAAAQLDLEKARHDLDQMVRDAPVNAAKAQVALAKAEIDLHQAERERERMDYPRTGNELVVEDAHTDYLLAKLALKDAKSAFGKVDHKRETNPERIVALKNLLAAQAQYDRALAIWNWYLLPYPPAEISQAEANLALALAAYDQAKDEWERIKDGPDPFELRLAEASVGDAEARLAGAQKALEAIELRAPFGGQILSLGISPGSQVTAFKPVLTLSDPADLEIVAYPSTADLSSLGIDQAASIQLSSRTGVNLTGYIRQVPFTSGSTTDQTGTGTGTGSSSQDVAVHIALDDPSFVLTLNEVATILIELETREGALWLPPAALRTFQGRDFVFIDENGVQRRVDVRLGLRSDERVEILEGLREGQVVIGP
jgi:HlyD family secretion protein